MVTLATALGYEDEVISLSAAGAGSLRTEESNDALQNAHSEITQFIDLLGVSGEGAMAKSDGKRMVPRLWRRSGAIAVTKTVISLIRYPLYTGTMYAQITGSGRSAWWAGAFSVFKRWWTIPLDAILHDFSGGHLGIVGGVVSLFNLKNRASSSLWRTLANICLHYWSFRMLYGAFRQVLVTRLKAPVSMSSAIMPALTWVRDRMLMRPDPYGSFLCVYVRDVCVSLFQGGLTLWLSRKLTSERAVGLYFSMANFDILYRNALTTVLDRIGLSSSAQSNEGVNGGGSHITRMLSDSLHTPLHPEGRANLSAAIAAEDDWELVEYSHDNSDPDIIFSNNFDTTPPPPALRRRQRRSENQATPPLPPLSTTKEMAQEVQFLIYTETVGAIVSGILTRAIFYPANAAVLRLMADQVGLTSHGYTGFFNVLSSCTLSSLYSSFTTNLVSDLAVGWLASEMAHYLCRTAWISI